MFDCLPSPAGLGQILSALHDLCTLTTSTSVWSGDSGLSAVASPLQSLWCYEVHSALANRNRLIHNVPVRVNSQ